LGRVVFLKRAGHDQRLRTTLSELLDHMEGAQEVASKSSQKYPDYEAMAEAVRSAVDMVAMACELEAYGEREGDECWKLASL
jgi:mitochondrial fission protein ELM1